MATIDLRGTCWKNTSYQWVLPFFLIWLNSSLQTNRRHLMTLSSPQAFSNKQERIVTLRGWDLKAGGRLKTLSLEETEVMDLPESFTKSPTTGRCAASNQEDKRGSKSILSQSLSPWHPCTQRGYKLLQTNTVGGWADGTAERYNKGKREKLWRTVWKWENTRHWMLSSLYSESVRCHQWIIVHTAAVLTFFFLPSSNQF